VKRTDTNRILVIGGTGFIGSNLVGYLAERGDEVVIYRRKDSDVKNLNGFPFTSVFGDLTDIGNIEGTLFQAMDGCKAVYNLAACGSPLKKYHRLREIVNREAAKTIAMVARKVGNLRLIHVSSSTAVGYPENNEIADKNYPFNAGYDHYALTKHQGEKAVLEEVKSGLDAVIAIPCSTVGSHGMKSHQLNVFKSISQGKTRVYPPGGLCLTNVNDLVKGLLLCCEKGVKGERYILGGNNITYKQYFQEIAYATHGKAPGIRLPKMLLTWLARVSETFFHVLKKEAPIDKNVAKMIGKNLFYSSELSKRELGYTITDWRKTIRETVNQLGIN